MSNPAIQISRMLEPNPAIRALLQQPDRPSVSLTEMSVHPEFKEKLRSLQAEMRLLYSSAIDDFAATLAGARFGTVATQGAVGGSSLARTSRRAGLDAKERVKYATLLITGAILNRNNIDWNPADPSSDKPDVADTIVMLMEMNLDR